MYQRPGGPPPGQKRRPRVNRPNSRPNQGPSGIVNQFGVAASRAKRNFAKRIQLRTNLNVSDEPDTIWFVIWGVVICCCASVTIFILVSVFRTSLGADPQEEYLKQVLDGTALDSSDLDLATVRKERERQKAGLPKKETVMEKMTNELGEKVAEMAKKNGKARAGGVKQGIIPPTDKEAEDLGIPKLGKATEADTPKAEPVKTPKNDPSVKAPKGDPATQQVEVNSGEAAGDPNTKTKIFNDETEGGNANEKPPAENAGVAVEPNGLQNAQAGQGDQASFEFNENERTKAVKESFLTLWHSKLKQAYGFTDNNEIDQIKPTMDRRVFFDMDLMKLLGLTEEYDKAKWLATEKSKEAPPLDQQISVWETSAKTIAGLLGSFVLDKDPGLVEAARLYGNIIVNAWDRESAVFPMPIVDIQSLQAKYHSWQNGMVVLSEAGGLNVELIALDTLSGTDQYSKKTAKINSELKRMAAGNDGMYAKIVDPNGLQFQPGAMTTVGAMADAFYQSLLKEWIQSGYQNQESLQMFLDAVDNMRKHLVQKVSQPSRRPEDYTFLADYNNGRLTRVFEEHACYFPGMLAEAAHHGKLLLEMKDAKGEALTPAEERLVEARNGYISLADSILLTCVQLYKESPDGLAPQAISFQKDAWSQLRPHDNHRPETLASLYFLALASPTKMEKKRYEDMGWEIFKAFTAAEAKDHSGDPSKLMTSTLKYAYLLFADEKLIDHGQYVLSTEGHLLPVIGTTG